MLDEVLRLRNEMRIVQAPGLRKGRHPTDDAAVAPRPTVCTLVKTTLHDGAREIGEALGSRRVWASGAFSSAGTGRADAAAER